MAAYLQDRTIDGEPRTSRRYRSYDNSPLPTMADKLLFILTYVKQHPIQEVQGQLFGMSGNVSDLHLMGLNPQAKFVPIDEQTDDKIMHLN